MSLPHKPESPWLQSTKGKVILAFLLGIAALAGSWLVNRFGFDELLLRVDRLSMPNRKVELFHQLHREIILHDQNMLTQETRTSGKVRKDPSALRQIRSLIDSLQLLSRDEAAQYRRLDSMRILLDRRDKLYMSYLRARMYLLDNRGVLDSRLAEMSDLLNADSLRRDSSVSKSTLKTTRRTLVPGEALAAEPAPQPAQRPGFFKRLFGRKKVEPPAAQGAPAVPMTLVEEESSQQTDTLSVATQDSLLQQLGREIRLVQVQRERQRAGVLQKKVEYMQASQLLITQLMGVLHDYEKEEFQLSQENSVSAVGVVSDSIRRMNAIIFLFFAGTFALVFLILIDIARSNRYRKALLAAKEEAEHLGQVKERFLANMSHEIRSPLQAILGFADQAREQGRGQQAEIEAIQRSSEHLLHIVNEVLDYSKLVSGKMRWESSPTDINATIEEAVSTFRFQARQKGLAFEYRSGIEKGTQVITDPFRLRQILYNVVGNALKFTDRGKVSLLVQGLISQGQMQMELRVEDSGIGMAPEAIESVFRQFEQADASVAGRYGGTGLGLSIVKELIESQGGVIRMQSAEGQGTQATIRMDLPLHENAGETYNKDVQAEPLPALAGEVWVIDDDPAILQICSTWLDRLSVRHHCTSDPQALLEACRQKRPALILADIRMPRMNGRELLREIRRSGDPDLPLVSMTAEVLPQDQESLLQEGFSAVLLKPFRLRELAAILRAHARQPLPQAHEEDAGEPDPLDILFREQCRLDQQALKDQLTGDCDRELAADILHRLAGRCGQFGHRDLYIRFRRIELALRQGDSLSSHIVAISSGLEDLDERIGTALQTLQ